MKHFSYLFVLLESVSTAFGKDSKRYRHFITTGFIKSWITGILAALVAAPLFAQSPPAVPTGLVAAAGSQQVTLIWSANSEADFLRYRIYGGTAASPTTQIDSTSFGVNDITITITSLTNGTPYFYRVTAVDDTSNESGYSNEVVAVPFSGGGNMLSLDGVNDYVTIPDNALWNFGSTDFTIELWANHAVLDLDLGLEQGGSEGLWQILWHSADDYHLRFYYEEAGFGTHVNLISPDTFMVDTWYHVAVVRDGNWWYLYQNGVIVASQSVNVTMVNISSTIIMGATLAPGAFFTGSIDELRIWNVARTEAQIRDNAHVALAGTETNLTGYWRFDEASGTVAYDQSGSGIHATLVNGTSRITSTTPSTPVYPPSVTSTTPTTNALNVASNSTISVNFDLVMDGASFNNSSMIVRGQYRGIYTGSYSLIDSVITFTPDSLFLPGELITVLLTDEIANIAGTHTSPGSYSFTVAVNGGYGTFKPAVEYAVGSSVVGLFTGDLNNNGILDVIVSRPGNNTIAIFTGVGDGTLNSPSTITVGSAVQHLTGADFNNDGNLDIVMTHYNDNSIRILPGNGDATFGTAGNYAVQTNPIGITHGDLNLDGNEDLVVLNSASGTVSVLLGNGDNTFATAVHYAAGAPLNVAVVVGDFNGDAIPDVAVGRGAVNTTDNIYIFIGKGDGTLVAAVAYAAGEDITDMAANDLNGDGTLDLWAANSGPKSYTFMTGNGDGTFSFSATLTPGQSSPAIGDMDGDGNLDIIGARYSKDDLVIFLGDGAGNFTAADSTQVGDGARTTNLGDMDGDGDLDVIIVNGLAGTVSVLINADVDIIAPATPTGLVAAAGNQKVDLHWNPNSEADFAKYNIYGGGTSAPTTLVDSATLGVNDTTITITGLTNGTPYFYRVTAVDDSSNESGYSGEVVAIPFAAGGNMLSLDGVNDYMTIPDNALWATGSNDFTIEMWVNHGELDRDVGLGQDGTEGQWQILWHDGNDYHLRYYYEEAGPVVRVSLVSPDTFMVDTWYHVAVVRDGNWWRLYQSGILVASDSVNVTLLDITSTMNLGATNATPGGFFKGKFDEVRIWNVARTEAQVRANMTTTVAADASGLVAYWRMDESSGTTAYDATPAGNHGTLVGGTVQATSTAPLSGEDLIAPDAPTGLVAVASNQQVDLHWNPNSEADFLRYRIYGGTAASPTTLIDSTTFGANDTTITITGLTNGTPYFYRVTAVDDTSNESGYSNEVVAVPFSGGGNMLSLDGVNDYVTIPDNALWNFGSTDFTIELWVNHAELDRDVGLGQAGTEGAWLILWHDGNDYHLRFYYEEPGPGVLVSLISPDTFMVDIWYHVAVVRDGNWWYLYQNGEIVASQSVNVTMVDITSTMNLGATTAPGNFFKGKFDELRIWNVARTEAQVQANMTTTVAADASGLVAYWRMDESSGTTAYDATSAGNHGTLVGGTVQATSTAPMSGQDLFAPDAPTGLVAAAGNLKVDLHWNPSSEADFLRYRIYGGTSAAPTTQIDSTAFGANDTTITITGLTNGTPYFYRVTAVDDTSNESGYSGEVVAIPFAAGGNMLSLDGVNDYMTIPDNALWNFGSNDFTIEFWANHAVLDLDEGLTQGGAEGKWEILWHSADNYHLRFYYEEAGVGTHVNLISPDTFMVDTWYHAAVVRAGNWWYLYQDGEIVASDSVNVTMVNISSTLNMGANNVPGTYFTGSFDELRIWNVARTEAQVQANMTTPIAPNETGLAGYWRMDESTGTTAYDATTAGNHGTLVGGTVQATSTAPLSGQDLFAPDAPTGLVAAAGNQKVDLHWNPSSEADFAKYNIYGGGTSAPTTLVDSATLGVNDTTITITGLTNGTPYFYRVTAVDDSSNESSYSGEVTATPFNTAPVITSDTIANATEDMPFVYHALGTDADGTTLNYIFDLSPGWTTSAGDSIYGTPLEGDLDTTFRVIASDGELTDTLVVAVTVTPVNDAPVAIADTVTTPEDTELIIFALTNDTDIDSDSLTIVGITQPTNGAAKIDSGATTLIYTPSADFWGADSLTYAISDGSGGLDTATVLVTVTAVNDAPQPFTLLTPKADSLLVVTAAMIGDSVQFVWESAFDPDGDTVKYFFLLTREGAVGDTAEPTMTLDTSIYVQIDSMMIAQAIESGGTEIVHLWDVMADDGEASILSTDFNRMFTLKFADDLLALGDRLGVPTAFALHQNYPNPFNPTSTIMFDLPKATDIHIVVYDLLGREVVRLLNQHLEPGFHELIWNGRDARGRDLPTGMYIVLMSTPQFNKSIKMLLLK